MPKPQDLSANVCLLMKHLSSPEKNAGPAIQYNTIQMLPTTFHFPPSSCGIVRKQRFKAVKERKIPLTGLFQSKHICVAHLLEIS